jgi:hypothetical protein
MAFSNFVGIIGQDDPETSSAKPLRGLDRGFRGSNLRAQANPAVWRLDSAASRGPARQPAETVTGRNSNRPKQ